MTDNHNKIILIDSTSSSLTVSWPDVPNAERYVLEFKTANDDSSFQLLSDKLKQSQARKNNLAQGTGYFFRVGAVLPGESSAPPSSWMTHETPFQLLTTEQEQQRMANPKAQHANSNLTFLVFWEAAASSDDKYELQMRENRGGADWNTIAPAISGTQVKKKNLTSPNGYQFRVRPVTADEAPFSLASPPAVARGLSKGIARWFASLETKQLIRHIKGQGGNFLRPAKGSNQVVPLDEALGGKEFILLYASAHWCPPCRQFTPQLAKWYQSVRNYGVEIVFVSCDHDEAGFQKYLQASHPWLAVDFDDDGREALLGHLKVKGIPQLTVLSGLTGQILEQNAVGKPFDLAQWRAMASSSKR